MIFFPFFLSCVFSRGGLTPNFGGVRSGFGDQKILSDLGLVFVGVDGYGGDFYEST